MNRDAAAMLRDLQPSQRGLVTAADWLEYMEQLHTERGEQVCSTSHAPARPQARVSLTCQLPSDPFPCLSRLSSDVPLYPFLETKKKSFFSPQAHA